MSKIKSFGELGFKALMSMFEGDAQGIKDVQDLFTEGYSGLKANNTAENHEKLWDRWKTTLNELKSKLGNAKGDDKEKLDNQIKSYVTFGEIKAKITGQLDEKFESLLDTDDEVLSMEETPAVTPEATPTTPSTPLHKVEDEDDEPEEVIELSILAEGLKYDKANFLTHLGVALQVVEYATIVQPSLLPEGLSESLNNSLALIEKASRASTTEKKVA